jgi:hypothetical protein
MKFLQLLKNPFANVALVVLCSLICLFSSGNETNGSHNFEGLFAILVFLFSGFITLSLYFIAYMITKKNNWFICWIGILSMICISFFVF